MSANSLTALRLFLTPVFVVLVLHPVWHGLLAAAVFAICAGSDYLDGRVARRLGTASERGRRLDHFTDIVYLLGALGVYVSIGELPWWVPASVAFAFSAYVFDSWKRSATAVPNLVASRLGHIGGICNWVIVATLVGNNTVGLHWIPPGMMTLFFLAVPVYSLAGIFARRREVRG